MTEYIGAPSASIRISHLFPIAFPLFPKFYHIMIRNLDFRTSSPTRSRSRMSRRRSIETVAAPPGEKTSTLIAPPIIGHPALQTKSEHAHEGSHSRVRYWIQKSDPWSGAPLSECQSTSATAHCLRTETRALIDRGKTSRITRIVSNIKKVHPPISKLQD